MRRINAFKLYAVLTALYLFIIIVMPPNPLTMDAYKLSEVTYRIFILITAFIPSVITWFAAFYGYKKFSEYATLVEHSKEGPMFAKIADGIGWLALTLPVISIISMAMSAIANDHPSFRASAIIISNYCVLIVSLIAFLILSRGARQAADSVRARPSEFATKVLSGIFIIVGAAYCYTLIHNADGTYPFKLHSAVILFTIIIPYLFAWFAGMLSVLDIRAYAANTKGLIYKKSLNIFSVGILTIIGSTIMLQYIYSASTQKSRTVLGGLLLIRYLLFGMLIIGFYLIAKSADKLKQIEKI